jgi:hypothetical protein
MLLALAVLCRYYASCELGVKRTMVMALLLLGVAIRIPPLTVTHAALWERCVQEGSTTELRDRLSLLRRMKWSDLEAVETYLGEQHLKDGELLCWAPRAMPLYQTLQIKPPVRYFLLHLNVRVFQRQSENIWAEVAASPLRLVVCDVVATYWKTEDGSGRDPFLMDPDQIPYPRDHLVFRAGRYAVYALDGAALRAWVDQHIEL